MTTLGVAFRVTMVFAGLALLGVSYRVARTRDATALRPFIWLVAIVGVLGVVDGLAAGVATALSIVWLVAYLVIPAVFAWFVVEYYGLPHLGSWQRRTALLVPVVAGVVGGSARILSPMTAGAMTGGGAVGGAQVPTVLSAAGVAEQAALYYAGGLVLVGVGLLGRTVKRYDHLDNRLGVVLSLVPLWPWLAYVVTPSAAGALPKTALLGVTATGYVFSVAAAVFAVTRGGLFDAAPAAGTLGPETVLDELDDPVVVVDNEERVVRLNDTAVATFEVGDTEAAGESLASVVGADRETLAAPDSVALEVAGGTRHFEASVSPVRDRLGRSPGHAVVLRDVTNERVRAQRLSVLNRVLRHNLRNEMTQIMGRAELIADDGTHSESAEAILGSAEDLVELGERAHGVEEMMSRTPRPETAVPLADLAEDVLERYRDAHSDASLAVDIDPSVTVAADRSILERVLDHLVENAIVHNDAPTPVVTVSARVEDESVVRLSVTDNGPGIPEQERSVIESGEESPLEHGSGLGLWAVNWGVTRIGGTLSFGENEPDGTVVTIALPTDVAAATATEQAAGAD